MDRLLEGYRRFRRDGWPDRRRLFETLAEHGQHPRALVLCCADSRVDPAMIFDAAPGELFVVRNVANLVPPYAPDERYHGTSAAIEFGIRALAVPDLVVMGHGLCGGVRALLQGPPPEFSDFVGAWMELAATARERAMACADAAERQLVGEFETVKLSLANLLGFPWIAERVSRGALRLHGAHFDIRSGALRILGPDGQFEASAA
ncbi:MAG TPA: carbonic anhydrase [Acetobacteraceae bacterium]|jgi:carbonic anhydrase|nr:carbonic anhydrase [Acetobacteraceae bacterium]